MQEGGPLSLELIDLSLQCFMSPSQTALQIVCLRTDDWGRQVQSRRLLLIGSCLRSKATRLKDTDCGTIAGCQRCMEPVVQGGFCRRKACSSVM